jgi:hypothetical protein
LALAYRSPLVGAIRYNVVGPRDHFVWRDGRTWVLEHEPAEEGWPDAMDEIRAAWCCIDLKSGFTIPRVMFRPEILRHKERGSASGRNPQPAWATDPSPMALKTVIGDACRRGPFEGEVGRAFALDLQGEVGLGQPEDAPTIDVQPTPQNGAGASTSFAEKFKAAHGAAPIEPPIEADPAPIAEPEYDGGPVGEAPPWEIDGEGEDIRLQFMAPVQVARVRAYAAQLGMSDLLLETVLGGRPEDLPAADEARFLALLRDYRPNGNGKAKR